MATQKVKREVGIREDDNGENGNQEEEEQEKWVKYYSSNHQILLVGEGDFSFSLCLATAFGSASNICATSLDQYDTVTKQYKNAKSNLETLRNLGASIIHSVNAKRMNLHTDLRMRKFDRIIFNFPHAGFHGKEDNTHIIDLHKKLVDGFFRSASCMLRPHGEVHVSHKTTAPFSNWNLPELALRNALSLIGCPVFNKEDYPGYNNKRGDGKRCDSPFPLGTCHTFMFKFCCRVKKSIRRRAQQAKEIPIQIHEDTSFGSRIPSTSIITGMNDMRYTMNTRREWPSTFLGDDGKYLIHGYFASKNITYPQPNFERGIERHKGLPLSNDIQRAAIEMNFGTQSSGFDNFRHPFMNFTQNTSDFRSYTRLPSTSDIIQREGNLTSNGFFSSVMENPGGVVCDADNRFLGSRAASQPTINSLLYEMEEHRRIRERIWEADRRFMGINSMEARRLVLDYGHQN